MHRGKMIRYIVVLLFCGMWWLGNATSIQQLSPPTIITLDSASSNKGETSQLLIYLHSNFIDPKAEEKCLQNLSLTELLTTSPERSEAEAGYYLMQFNLLPDEQEREFLTRRGVTFYDYIPENCFLVKLPAGEREYLLKHYSGIRWIGEYKPFYKLSRPVLLDYKLAKNSVSKVLMNKLSRKEIKTLAKTNNLMGAKEYIVLCYPDVEVGKVTGEIKAVGGEVEAISRSERKIKLKVRITPARLAELARIPAVRFIEPMPQWTLWNNRAADQGVCFTRYVWDSLRI
ncbi:MAG: hypothetical protein N2246_01320, partial [Candidatus Sumerlaeia bacterium]|nr:hypothetical protein [Candidatus Sumerlaeia bacterium]